MRQAIVPLVLRPLISKIVSATVPPASPSPLGPGTGRLPALSPLGRRPASDRSDDGAPGVRRQAIRPFGQPRGSGSGRGARFLLCVSVLLVLGWPVPGLAQPTVAITWDEQAAWQEPSFTVTFTFSEAVEGFTGEVEDILLSTLFLLTGANFQALSATTYTLEVTPNAGAAFVNVLVKSGAAQAVNGGAENAETVVVIYLIPDPPPVPPVTGDERAALDAFYAATDGANWTTNTNWEDATKPLGERHGVTTNSDGQVTQLSLRSNNLSGTLPAAVGNLRHLERLYLDNNALSGAIPVELGHLRELQYLYLYNNELSGEIPVELSYLRELTRLYLRNNTLSGAIPAELGLLSKLTFLYLYNNTLSGEIPAALGRLSKLQRLHLYNNTLSGEIPAALGQLGELIDLKLHSNANLRGPLPDTFPTGLTKLMDLIMQNTQVTVPETPAFTNWDVLISSGTQASSGVITLDPDNRLPSGLWADSTTLYVVGEVGEKVYAYRLADGARDAAKDITLHSDNGRPTGLWSDGTTLWVLDYDDKKIYAYTLADGMRDTNKDITVQQNAYGLWGLKDEPCQGANADCLLWTAKYGQAPIQLYAHRIYEDTSITYGSAARLKNLSSDVLLDILWYVRGLWWEVQEEPDRDPSDDDEATVWISDTLDARLYAYTATPRFTALDDIEHVVAQDRILAPDNLRPTAIWSDGTTWWVADTQAGKVFVYGPRVSTPSGGGTDPPGGGGTDPPGGGGTDPPGGGGGTDPPGGGGGTDPPGGGGGRGGRGGGGGRDLHGDTAAQATPVPVDAARTASTVGQLNTPDDVDYFTVDVPHAGVLVVETTGSTDTVGTVWQDGEELATADSGGAGQNFRLSVRVEAGAVVMAVAGNGRQTGRYTLRVTILPGNLENPGPDSFQSGIGVISGWVCAADAVELEIGHLGRQFAAYGTDRADTEYTEEGEELCGDTDNGFGLLFNWNLLGEGEHEVVAYVDDIEFSRATVTVTTLGAEFLRGVAGECVVEDFPLLGKTVTLAWQQTSQNFVITEGSPPAGVTTGGTSALMGVLENPGHNSFQSGVRVLSGWVCDADTVELAIGTAGRQVAAYGTERVDTEPVCGDTDNGFGLLFNWNLLGEGEHEVVAYVDGEELGRATVRVTTLGVEFLRGVEGECVVADFPRLGQSVLLEWQQNSQNFVMTDVE